MLPFLIVIAVLLCIVLGVVAFFLVLSTREELHHLRLKINLLTTQLKDLSPTTHTGLKDKPLAEPKKIEAQEEPSSKIPIIKEESKENGLNVKSSIPQKHPQRSDKKKEPTTSKVVSKSTAPTSISSFTKGKSPSPSLESIIGKRWMTWLGVAILFFSAAFFLKYAFENDIIGPTGQITLCALFGIGVLIGGTHFINKGMRALGQGLMGLGLAILYITFSAASSSLYSPPVLPPTPSFLLLVIVTLCGIILSILHNAQPIATLALLGGLLTPILVSTGQNSRDALFTYLTLLDLGVIGVAFFRRWKTLDAIAIVGTFLLYSGWFEKHYSSTQLIPAILWLSTFYALFLMLPFIFHLVKKTEVTLERFILALVNAIFSFCFMWYLLHKDYPHTLGFIAIAMAAIYLTMGVLFRRRLPKDKKTLFSSISLSVTFLTMALPLHLKANGITLAWAIEGPILLYLGYRFRYFPVRIFGGLVLSLSFIRLFSVHWPLHHGLYIPFFNRHFLSAMLVPAAMEIYGFIHHKHKDLQNHNDRVFKIIFSLGGAFLTLVIVQHESFDWLLHNYNRYTATCAASIIWSIGSFVYLISGKRTRSTATWFVGCFSLFISFIHLCHSLSFTRSIESLLFLNFHFLSGITLVTSFFLFGKTIASKSNKNNASMMTIMGKVLWGLGIFLLFGLISYEIPTYVYRCLKWSDEAAQMSLTVSWGLYASALLGIGFWKGIRPLRYSGLALFGISALKLLIIDMSQVEDILRIISFLIVGVLMLAASYFYHRLEAKLNITLAKQSQKESKQ